MSRQGTMTLVRFACAWTSIAVAAWPTFAGADDRSGVRPAVLSVPAGPGSIEGLGEGFEPSLQSGSARFAISIRVPPAVADHTPALRLSYATGAGNGELGLGWSLALPSIQRGTDRQLPRYDPSDLFVVRGGEGAGSEELIRLTDGTYRFRIEGAFARGFQRGDGTWELRGRSGATSRFGEGGARIESGERVFSWLLTRDVDLYGNAISYAYERDQTGRPYLSRVVYNDFSPEARNEVVFDYEDRPDALTSYLATFPVTMARRLARIEVRHGGELFLTYGLRYDETGGLSRLTEVRLRAADGTALPPLTVSYAQPELSAAGLVTVADAPARMLGPVTELDDVDGDSLVDLLVADPALDGGRYSYYSNLDGTRFAARQVLTSSPSAWLTSPGAQLADLDGDGAADVVAKLSSSSDGFRYYPAIGTGMAGFGDGVVISPNPSFALESADVRLVDLDHDRRTDWLRSDPSTGLLFASFNRGAGRFTAETSLGRLDPAEVLSFSGGLRLSDMNGDGLADLVMIRSGSGRFWPAMGRGAFDRPVSLPGVPTLSGTELAALLVQDATGDGLADLIHVGGSQVRVWRNQAGTSFASPVTIPGTPALRPESVVRLADMNGNGSADIVWVTPSDGAAPWKYFDLLGRGAPGLLTRIDNGLGKVTTIDYAGLGAMRAWARESGISWTRRSAVGHMVVSRIAVEDGLGGRMESELRYADAYFDGPTREFRGFGRAVRIDRGDAEQPTLVTDSQFDVGDTDEARKGLVLLSTRRTEAGFVFDQTETTYIVREVTRALDETPIRYAFASRQDTRVFEGQDSPRLLATEWERDGAGNVILEVSHGEIGPDGDPSVGDDERIIERNFARPVPGGWVLDRVAIERVRSGGGRLLAETRTTYDGDGFAGLPVGQVQSGAPTRVETWIEGGRFALKEAFERDIYGNVTRRRDGRGGLVGLTYADDHTFLREVRTQITEDGSLAWSVEFDPRLGVMTRLIEPDGEESRFRYDGLGRPTAFIRPGDSEALPTQTFDYTLDAPLSTIRSEIREQSGEAGGIVQYSHVDGLGRARGTFEEAPDRRWIALGLTAYGARGWPRFVQHPDFEGNADPISADEDKGGVWTIYDALGRKIQEQEVGDARRQWEYLPLAVRISNEDDLDPTSSHVGTPTTQEKDGLGRVRRVIELDADRDVVTAYDHDALGNLVAVTDARGIVRRYEFDGRSRQTAVVDPNAGRWTFTYDDGDGLVVREDSMGNRVSWTRDLAGRPLDERQTTAAGATQVTVRYHYDEASSVHPSLSHIAGRLAWVEDEAGTLYLGYDRRGRLTDRIRRWTDGTESATWTEHDAADRVVRRGFPDGTYLPFDYDARGNLRSAGGLLTAATWTADDRLDCAVFGNAVRDCRAYDHRRRLSRMKATGPSGRSLRDLTFTRDAASHIRAILDGRKGVEPRFDLSLDVDHDDRDRMIHAADKSGATTWEYDDIGNLLRVGSDHDDPALNAKFSHGEAGAGPDQLTSAGDETLRYDPAGRLLEDGERKYEWDPKGRLRRVVRGETVEEYVYNFEDARAIKTTRRGNGSVEVVRTIDSDVEERAGQLVRYFVFDGGRAVTLPASSQAESSGTATMGGRTDLGGLALFTLLGILGLGSLLIARTRVPRAATNRRSWAELATRPLLLIVLILSVTCGHSGGSAHGGVPIDSWPAAATLELTDHQQSVVASIDAGGQVVAERAYHPYGLLRASRGAALPRLFVGNERDDAVGLDNFHARAYRSSVARFISFDPIVVQPEDAAQAAHPAYAYTAGNPIDTWDPDGREKGLLSSSAANDTCRAQGGCSHKAWAEYRDAAKLDGDPHAVLDVVGLVDPFGIADGLNALIYFTEGTGRTRPFLPRVPSRSSTSSRFARLRKSFLTSMTQAASNTSRQGKQRFFGGPMRLGRSPVEDPGDEGLLTAPGKVLTQGRPLVGCARLAGRKCRFRPGAVSPETGISTTTRRGPSASFHRM